MLLLVKDTEVMYWDRSPDSSSKIMLPLLDNLFRMDTLDFHSDFFVTLIYSRALAGVAFSRSLSVNERERHLSLGTL